MAIPASGEQYALRSGEYEAVIAGVGAALRVLTHRGRDLVLPFRADEVRPAYRGVTLAPWPNRVVDGRYLFGGREHRLALSEPDRGHALHGLLAWTPFEAVERHADRVVLRSAIVPQAGYPWRVAVTVTFAVGAGGLVQTVLARNESADPAPWGTGPHPYLLAGSGRLDEWSLELPATQVLAVTADRLIPTTLAAVDAVAPERFDFRAARPIGAVRLDHAYTGLLRDADGIATVRLTDTAGVGAAMSWDGGCPWVQIHTADSPIPQQSRLGLAVEPMTCAPDAFNAASHPYDAGLTVIGPGRETSASWRLSALG